MPDFSPQQDNALRAVSAWRVADPARNFVVIMKDGTIHKNTLAN